tara:strand:+ start:6941 stop:7327 length:387 start_codon:yes stop_codon:yes gene_type:complete
MNSKLLLIASVFVLPLLSFAEESSKPITITAENIDEILASGQPVLIDFWAAWCGPCKRIAPAIEELAAEYDGKLIVGKVNIDQQKTLARSYRIRSIPNLKIFKDGKVVEEIKGAVPKTVLVDKLSKHL